jgi:propionyl-CoA carboxylase beta chain
LLSYIPQNCEEKAPEAPYTGGSEIRKQLAELVPANPNQPYDMREVIQGVVDDNSFLEVHAGFAGNILVGFARLAGKSIGVVANQPAVLAGVLDVHASQKGARFVRFCDAFNIPLLSIRRCARLFARYRSGVECHYNQWCEIAVRIQ